MWVTLSLLAVITIMTLLGDYWIKLATHKDTGLYSPLFMVGAVFYGRGMVLFDEKPFTRDGRRDVQRLHAGAADVDGLCRVQGIAGLARTGRAEPCDIGCDRDESGVGYGPHLQRLTSPPASIQWRKPPRLWVSLYPSFFSTFAAMPDRAPEAQ